MFNKKLIERIELSEKRWLRLREDVNALYEFKNKYVECSVCGCLVNESKAKVEWEMRDKEEFNSCGILLWRLNGKKAPEKEAVKTYKCKHCQKAKGKRK